MVPHTKIPYFHAGFESGKPKGFWDVSEAATEYQGKPLPPGVYAFLFSAASLVNFADNPILADALADTADGRLVFTFALEDAGDYFWKRALHRVDVNTSYWKWERN